MTFASALREVPGAGLEPACPKGFARGSVRVVTHDIRVRSPRGAGGGTRTRTPPKGAPDFKSCPGCYVRAQIGTSPYVSLRLDTSEDVALWHSNGTGGECGYLSSPVSFSHGIPKFSVERVIVKPAALPAVWRKNGDTGRV